MLLILVRASRSRSSSRGTRGTGFSNLVRRVCRTWTPGPILINLHDTLVTPTHGADSQRRLRERFITEGAFSNITSLFVSFDLHKFRRGSANSGQKFRNPPRFGSRVFLVFFAAFGSRGPLGEIIDGNWPRGLPR